MTKVTDQQIVNAATSSQTMYEAARKIEIHPTSFILRAKRLGVYKPNQGRAGLARPIAEKTNNRIPLKEILEGKHPQYSTSLLHKRLVAEGIKKDECEECNERDQTISYELDHIDGHHSNHKLKNLRILCPNCHSKTRTFAGRNKKKKTKPTFDTVIVNLICDGKSTLKVLTQLKMVPNGVNYRRVNKLRSIVEYIQNRK